MVLVLERIQAREMGRFDSVCVWVVVPDLPCIKQQSRFTIDVWINCTEHFRYKGLSRNETITILHATLPVMYRCVVFFWSSGYNVVTFENRVELIRQLQGVSGVASLIIILIDEQLL